MKVIIILAFVLLLALVLVAYYVGTVNDIASISGAVKRSVFWMTGRDQNGNTITSTTGG